MDPMYGRFIPFSVLAQCGSSVHTVDSRCLKTFAAMWRTLQRAGAAFRLRFGSGH